MMCCWWGAEFWSSGHGGEQQGCYKYASMHNTKSTQSQGNYTKHLFSIFLNYGKIGSKKNYVRRYGAYHRDDTHCINSK